MTSAVAATILIPTYNRHRYLARVLRYVQAVGTPYRMLVLDSSSDAPEAEALELLKGTAGVQHVRYPSALHPLDKICDGLAQITSPYAVLWADDDFLIPETVEEAVRVLDRHRDYSVVHGTSGLFRLAPAPQGHDIQWVAPYLQRSIMQETAAERLLDHFQRYSVMFSSVHRTAQLREALERCRQRGFRHTWSELALGALSVIRGKVKQLDRLYMLREVHQDRDSWNAQGHPVDVFDWISHPTFAATSEAFRTCLAEALAAQDGIAMARAQAVVKQALWSYIASVLTAKWHGQYAAPGRSWMERAGDLLRPLPGLRPTWRAVRGRLPTRRRRELDLDVLRRPSSPYHADFSLIEQVVTEPT